MPRRWRSSRSKNERLKCTFVYLLSQRWKLSKQMKIGSWLSMDVAQLVEQSFPIPKVRGSNPIIGKSTLYCQLQWNTKIKKWKRPGMAQLEKGKDNWKRGGERQLKTFLNLENCVTHILPNTLSMREAFSVTRFGEISPLWQTFISIWQYFWG